MLVMRNVTKMKSGAVHPVIRRSLTSSYRKGSTSPDRASVLIGPSPLIRHCLYIVACIASVLIGFRFSRETLLVLFRQPEVSVVKTEVDVGLKFPYVPPSEVKPEVKFETKSSRVHVGRHEILIRAWPHPDGKELYRAHALLERVQKEQRDLYGPRNWRSVICITPTYVRTFQAVHLLGVMHTLKSVPNSVVWIVVEAGGKTNDTGSILVNSGLSYVHLGVDDAMPASWELRRRMETRLRVEALRYVRREKLDGIIVFADDSNVHSLQLFDEVQKVNWIGALSVGLFETPSEEQTDLKPRLPVQGPACNETCNVIGWHALRSSFTSGGIMDVATHLEWSGFVINSRALWEDSEKPEWISEFDEWIGEDISKSNPLRLAKEQSYIEALGNCGREVMLWSVRAEARADSRFPSRWVLEEPLEVTVPAKRTPWPPYVEQNTTSVNTKHRSPKTRRTKKNRLPQDSYNTTARVNIRLHPQQVS